MDRAQIEMEARLQAIEYLLRHLLVVYFASQPNPRAALADATDQMKGVFALETLGGSDPALSDHLIAEIESAIDAQLAGVAQHPAMEPSR